MTFPVYIYWQGNISKPRLSRFVAMATNIKTQVIDWTFTQSLANPDIHSGVALLSFGVKRLENVWAMFFKRFMEVSSKFLF